MNKDIEQIIEMAKFLLNEEYASPNNNQNSFNMNDQNMNDDSNDMDENDLEDMMNDDNPNQQEIINNFKNSLRERGMSDSDIDSALKDVLGESKKKKRKRKKKKMSKEENPCWDGYEMVGMKKKNGKEVPNCVPVNEAKIAKQLFLESLSHNEIITEAEYQGRDVTLNKPFRNSGGDSAYSVYVKNDKGNVVKVNFGDANMGNNRDNPEKRKAFRARHNCSDPGPKWKAKYWSCKFWSTTPVSELLGESRYKLETMEIFESMVKDKNDSFTVEITDGEQTWIGRYELIEHSPIEYGTWEPVEVVSGNATEEFNKYSIAGKHTPEQCVKLLSDAFDSIRLVDDCTSCEIDVTLENRNPSDFISLRNDLEKLMINESQEWTKADILLNYIINDGSIYVSHVSPTLENLKKKVDADIYDEEAALVSWMKIVDLGAKKYFNEFGRDESEELSWHSMFDSEMRETVARDLQNHYNEQLFDTWSEIDSDGMDLLPEFKDMSMLDKIQITEHTLKKFKPVLSEGVMDFSHSEEGTMFNEAQRRLEVAKKAFGIVNRLRDPEEKRTHRAKLARYMNQLRAFINRLINKFTVIDDEPQQSHGGSRFVESKTFGSSLSDDEATNWINILDDLDLSNGDIE